MKRRAKYSIRAKRDQSCRSCQALLRPEGEVYGEQHIAATRANNVGLLRPSDVFSSGNHRFLHTRRAKRTNNPMPVLSSTASAVHSGRDTEGPTSELPLREVTGRCEVCVRLNALPLSTSDKSAYHKRALFLRLEKLIELRGSVPSKQYRHERRLRRTQPAPCTCNPHRRFGIAPRTRAYEIPFGD